jgi:hypothetical protein
MTTSEDPKATDQAEVLAEARREKLDTLRRVLRIRIDGDWDDAMINTAFTNLEQLLFRLESDAPPEEIEESEQKPSKSRGSSGRRRSRRK